MGSKYVQVDDHNVSEWLEAYDDVLEHEGSAEALRLLESLKAHAAISQIGRKVDPRVEESLYENTCYNDHIPPEKEKSVQIEKWCLWNAMAMVVRAGKKNSSLGGHIATFASASTLYRVGFDYCFKAHQADNPGDLVYFQGHASPGIYAQSFLEGRFTEQELDAFRQEVSASAKGLSSYPHPWLMPDYWEFATVSMGLGPLQGIWAAKWLKVMHDRGLQALNERRVWVFCGDGEMDEPESRGCLHVASEYRLDHLIFVINCNLQRLDGPVRGNAKIIQQLEKTFLGAGWRVIKVVWNSAWDEVFARDASGKIKQYLHEMLDGTYQAFEAQGPRVLLRAIASAIPEVSDLINSLPSALIERLAPGGHDHVKVYTAYKEALNKDGRPTVVLAHTQKGRGLGARIAGANTTHQHKKLEESDLKHYAKWCRLDDAMVRLGVPNYVVPKNDHPCMQWLHAQRLALGGYLPRRWQDGGVQKSLTMELSQHFLESSGTQTWATTMVFVRLLLHYLRSPELKEALLPIVADESRTFGMEGLFRQIGIYAPGGQQYTPVDHQQLMVYKESATGQLLQEGINEAGAFAAWLAAATSYSHSQKPIMPMYIFYSMFGFQRIGDLIWAAADMRARGFLLGATSGRTTLAGEGLQHCDGQSMLSASMVPNCISYDPCYHYELAVIMQRGLKRMWTDGEDVFYYIALANETYTMPEMPKGVDCDIEELIAAGMYPLNGQLAEKVDVHLLGGGVLLREAIEAKECLATLGINAKVWSVTSFTELAREGRRCQRKRSLALAQKSTDRLTWSLLERVFLPSSTLIAVTDHVSAYAEQIRAYVKGSYRVLGTDGFGRSDTREALRRLFRVNADSIALAACEALAEHDTCYHTQVEKMKIQVQAIVFDTDPMEE